MFEETASQERDERDGPEGQVRKGSWPKKKWISLVLLGLAIVMAGIAFVIIRAGSKSAPDSVSRTKAARSVGAEVRLYLQGRNEIMVATDEKTLDDLIRALSARTDEVQQLIQSGRVFTVPSDTRARIIEMGFGKAKVRIIEGDKILSEGWVPESWVW